MTMTKSMLFLCAAAGIAATTLVPTLAAAQDWPKAPVRIILPFTPGGGDQVFRIIAPLLQEKWKQPVVIEYKPGEEPLEVVHYPNPRRVFGIGSLLEFL